MLWRADQQNETLAEIREALVRPLETQARELRERGIYSYDNGWMGVALADFLDAMQKSRIDYVVAHYLGNIYMREGDFETAATWFANSAKWSRPKEPRHAAVALMHQALAAMLTKAGDDAGNYRQAVVCLDEALLLDPTNLEATFQRAQCRARLGESAAALVDLEEALDHDGRYLVRVLIESDFRGLQDEIADLVYWLTRSYSRTIERQLRLLRPFLRQVEDGVPIEGTDAVIDPYADDEVTRIFVEAVTTATELYALGDFHSVQQAQALLLALPGPGVRTVSNARMWVEYPRLDRSGATVGTYGGYRQVSYMFYGVGGDLV